MTEDLGSQIATAERRLIEREDRLRRQWRSLGQDVRRAVQPRRMVVPLIAAAAMLLLVSRLLRRPQLPERRTREGLLARIPWMQLAALALPLLPLHWRERFNPPSLIHRFARSMGAQGSEADRTRPPPQTAAAVDLTRYAGTWCEIARLPNRYEDVCAGQPSATYTPRDGEIEVVNRCRTQAGRERVAHGVTHVVAGSGGARLRVSFAPRWLHWLPAVWADYWILHVDDAYQVALVGTPQRDALWVLARHNKMSAEQAEPLLQLAVEQGYSLDRLIVS